LLTLQCNEVEEEQSIKVNFSHHPDHTCFELQASGESPQTTVIQGSAVQT